MKEPYRTVSGCCLALMLAACGTADARPGTMEKTEPKEKTMKTLPLEKPRFIRHEMIGCVNITPMIPGREKEIIADVRDMHGKGVLSRAAFIAYLVPDGCPPADSATPQAAEFAKYKAMLAGSGIPVGILLQNTMGHPHQKRKHPFQKVTRVDGSLVEACCPADPGFLDYMRKAIRTVAGARPDFIILDDDTRLRPHGFCFCSRHIEAFNKKTGGTITDPAKIAEKLRTDPAFYEAWARCQAESLGVFAGVIREALDAVDPAIEAIACGDGGKARDELMEKISRLTGKGQIPTIRFGNAVYVSDSGRGFPGWMFTTRYQTEVAFPKDIRILAEVDTCPHLLYATGAQMLHWQYAMSLLFGCCGGKLWITDLSDYNPENGLRYREKLAKYAGFYREIGKMIPEWEGVVVPFPARKQEFSWPRWGDPVLATWGVPFSYERCHKTDRLVALSDAFFKSYTQEELKTMLSGRVLLDGSAAVALTRLGFGDLIGCDARQWDLPRVMFEEGIRDVPVRRVPKSVILENLRPGAEVRTRLHVKKDDSFEIGTVLPGAVRFRNALGGEIYTVAGIASQTNRDDKFGAFYFMNLIRREFLARELGFGMYHAGEEPIFVGRFRDRGRDCAVLVNFGLDAVDRIPFRNFPADVGKVEFLAPDGSWREVACRNGVVEIGLPALDIAFLRFSGK